MTDEEFYGLYKDFLKVNKKALKSSEGYTAWEEKATSMLNSVCNVRVRENRPLRVR